MSSGLSHNRNSISGNGGCVVAVRIFGYCSRSSEEISAIFSSMGPLSLSFLPGVFVISVITPEEEILISSHCGSQHHYYATTPYGVFHGTHFFDVFSRSNLSWEWDIDSLCDLFHLDFIVGDGTIHRRIKRLPAGTVMRIAGGTCALLKTCSWDEKYGPDTMDVRPSLEIARIALNDEVRTWMNNDRIVVPLSGGYDSRVILSSVLANGRIPTLVTMGPRDCTDVIVASKIATSLGMEHRTSELNLDDYIASAERITQLAGGMELAHHWHTYIYPRKLGVEANDVFLGGNAGEFANNGHQLDYGLVSYYGNALFPEFMVRMALLPYWMRRSQWPIPMEYASKLEGQLGECLRPSSRLRRTWRYASRIECGSLLDRLDRWFLEERVRSFHGISQKLLSESCIPVSPFLSRKWLASIWNLPRRYKHGLQFARYALHRNAPRLLDFCEVSKKGIISTRTSRRPKMLYWCKERPIEKWKPFVDIPQLFKERYFEEVIMDSHSLWELFNRKQIEAILRDSNVNTWRATSFLFTLAKTYEVLEKQ